ncbi:MAG: spore photoproduct lyase family protein [Phycisphaerae bacterium]|jgi:spore photoproduct lyase
MDTAKNFNPDTILLWDKVSGSFEAQRIISLFKNAEVKIITEQKLKYAEPISAELALRKSKKTLMIGETSSFINQFDGNIGENMRCFPYYKLVPLSNGCPYNCVYCYLAYVYRKYGAFIKMNINYDKMLRQIDRLAKNNPHKICFNLGEMLDSLALDHITNLTTMLVPLFRKYENKYLMMLTKSSNIDNLMKMKPNRQIIVSWSLNPQIVIDNFEFGTASLDERLAAAKKCQELGYRIRFRIDPGILCDDWKTAYAMLIQKIFDRTEPENITIGLLRLFKGHINLSKKAYDLKTFEHLPETAKDNKLRYPTERCVEFYEHLINVILGYSNKTSIGICRESQDILNQLNFKTSTCNCIA